MPLPLATLLPALPLSGPWPCAGYLRGIQSQCQQSLVSIGASLMGFGTQERRAVPQHSSWLGGSIFVSTSPSHSLISSKLRMGEHHFWRCCSAFRFHCSVFSSVLQGEDTVLTPVSICLGPFPHKKSPWAQYWGAKTPWGSQGLYWHINHPSRWVPDRWALSGARDAGRQPKACSGV